MIDSHTAGEPTRIIVEGYPDVLGDTMAERKACLRDKMDWLRRSLRREPRGHRNRFGGVRLETPAGIIEGFVNIDETGEISAVSRLR